ncbi:MAG: aminopeptidase P family protein [Candidatus Helarchaeota archaeon]|nr:aminopeptidase P family protein [Candidatus Helarchaeota archaeon]
MSERLTEFQKKLQEAELDAFFISNITNSYYFTKFLSHSYVYLIVFPDDTPYFFVPELEFEDAVRKVKNCEVVKVGKKGKVLELIKGKLENKQVKNLGIEENSMSVKLYLDISEKYDFLELENGSVFIDNLRKRKNKDEIEQLKMACQIADKGFVAAIENITEGKTEIEIAAEIEYVMRKNGSEATPFDTIVASGHRSAFPHGVSTHKKIESGDLIIIDLGATYEGYRSDMTRTVVLGAPSPKSLKVFNAVLETQQEAIKACDIEKHASDIEKKAREILSAKGLNDYFVHSLGHGVGLDVHELPTLALISEDILMENNVFTIEPGVYIPNFGGVRIEDVVHLTKKGAEPLTKSEYTIKI